MSVLLGPKSMVLDTHFTTILRQLNRVRAPWYSQADQRLPSAPIWVHRRSDWRLTLQHNLHICMQILSLLFCLMRQCTEFCYSRKGGFCRWALPKTIERRCFSLPRKLVKLDIVPCTPALSAPYLSDAPPCAFGAFLAAAFSLPLLLLRLKIKLLPTQIIEVNPKS